MSSVEKTGTEGAQIPPGGRSWLRALLGVALATLGAGAFLIGSSLDQAGARTVGGNLPINEGAKLRTDINAHNSPTVARNPAEPSNLVVVNRIDTPRFSCAIHTSFDAGARWKSGDLPFPEGEEAPPRCFAPDVAFDSEGTMFVSFVTLKGAGNTPNAMWLVSSEDGGRTISTPAKVLGPSPPFFFQARLSADPKVARRLYLSWLQADETSSLAFPNPGNPINLLRSDDGGASWVGPVQVSSPQRGRVIAPSTAVGPKGEVYLSYLDLKEDALDYDGAHEGQGGEPYPGRYSLVVARSTDEGETWKETEVDSEIRPIERFIVFFPPTPSVAVDQKSGAVYVSFHDARSGDPDVYVWTSKNQGQSFSPPKRVNDTKTKDGTFQYMPKVAVAPNGRLDVVYYDRRADPKNIMNEVSFQSSTDQAETFTRRMRLSDHEKPFDSRIGFGSERQMPDLGSRLGLVSTNSRALAVWTDTRGGTEASNKQDLGRAVVAFTEGSALRQPLRYGGPVLILIGILVLLSWVTAGRGGSGLEPAGDREPREPEPTGAAPGAQKGSGAPA